MRTLIIIIFLLFETLNIAGCGDPKVTGTVKYKDGTPLVTGTVVLQNAQSQGIGELQSDGSFELYQFKKGDGLERGTYRGYITNAVIIDDQMRTTSLIPDKYTDINRSDIEYDSEKNQGKLEITIDAFPPKK
jgi:hypothetical protein